MPYKNPEDQKEYHKKYYARKDIKEKRKQYLHDYARSEKGRKIRSDHNKKSRQSVRAEIIKRLGDKCKHCGYTDSRALQIDHISGGGRKEILSMAPYTYYNSMLKMNIKELKMKYQVLCSNCNWIKRSTNHELVRGTTS